MKDENYWRIVGAVIASTILNDAACDMLETTSETKWVNASLEVLINLKSFNVGVEELRQIQAKVNAANPKVDFSQFCPAEFLKQFSDFGENEKPLCEGIALFSTHCVAFSPDTSYGKIMMLLARTTIETISNSHITAFAFAADEMLELISFLTEGA